MTSYLLRILLPDQPGSLGAVATALGGVGADIQSLDVVERGDDGAVDDLVVDLDSGLADTLITAAQSVEGVVVESLRPYLSGRDIHRDLELVDELAADPAAGMELLVANAPGVFRAGWAVLLTQTADGAELLHESPGAPDLDGLTFSWLPLHTARRMGPGVREDEAWIPERWIALGMEMAAAPAGSPDCVVIVGRPGGPRFRASEVLRLAHLAGIAATVARAV